MSDIKHIKFDIPAPAAKTRKGRKSSVKPVSKAKSVAATSTSLPNATSDIPVNTNAAVATINIANTVNKAKTVKSDIKKKPTINVNLPYANSPHTPAPIKKVVPVPPPVKVVQKAVVPTRKAPLKVNVQKNKRKNFTLKRKFVARKITINIENANKIKKNREAVEKKVANMPMAEITKNLRANGLVRPDANPPEKMQKTMMIDLLLFPVPL